ncbi:unnamed protein product [Auanema sp. JU1783]|nr:unnamed protein product [Auanema sp. JU1783]
MGSGMAKYSDYDPYYKRRRGARVNSDVEKCFSKEYCEYWKVEPKKVVGENFLINRNEYGTSNKSYYEPRTKLHQRSSQFVSSFSSSSSSDKSSGYSNQR